MTEVPGAYTPNQSTLRACTEAEILEFSEVFHN